VSEASLGMHAVSLGVHGVVAPMILQFFVLALYWFGGVPLKLFRGLLPFLMIATGVLFFSVPLEPIWGPVVGAASLGFGGIPAGLGLVLVLAMNVGVAAWVVAQTGGWRGSGYRLLLLSYPALAFLLARGWGGGLWGAGVAVVLLGGSAVLTVALARNPGLAPDSGLAPHPAGTDPTSPSGGPSTFVAPSRLVIGLGVALLLVLAGWLGR
jgi:hypothetical protein